MDIFKIISYPVCGIVWIVSGFTLKLGPLKPPDNDMPDTILLVSLAPKMGPSMRQFQKEFDKIIGKGGRNLFQSYGGVPATKIAPFISNDINSMSEWIEESCVSLSLTHNGYVTAYPTLLLNGDRVNLEDVKHFNVLRVEDVTPSIVNNFQWLQVEQSANDVLSIYKKTLKKEGTDQCPSCEGDIDKWLQWQPHQKKAHCTRCGWWNDDATQFVRGSLENQQAA